MSFWNLGTTPEGGGERAPLPHVGETVRLQVLDDFHLGVYHARVRALAPRRLVFDSPEAIAPVGASEEESAPLTGLPVRTPLLLSFLRADEMYQCETRAVGPPRAGLLVVARPRVVTRVQRRQFYRLPLQSPTTFRVRGEYAHTDPVAARLVNLSGGGALLSAPKPVPGGLRVRVRVPTGQNGALLEVDGDVLDCRVATQGLARVFLVRVRFLGPPLLSEEERDAIVAYIFEQQRLLLRTRKLLR
jgi:hypothetical protein